MYDGSTQLNFNQTMLDLNEDINRLRRQEADGDRCSFCGKPQNEVGVLVPGPNGVHICDQCVARAAKLIGQRTA